MSYPTIKLKKNRDGNVVFQHPWIFSGAIEYIPPSATHGSLVRIENEQGQCLGVGTFSQSSSITVRILDFNETVIDEKWWEEKIENAKEQRELLGYGQKTETTGYRLLFAEADGVPGLVVDVYEKVLVLQISTAAMEMMKPQILAALKKIIKPKAIVERSDLFVRREEDLEEFTGILEGKISEPIEFLENGLRFTADTLSGQKTGFFTDQKNLRSALEKFSEGRNVLDTFSYSGAAGNYALRGGASSVTFLDASQDALELCKAHVALNFPKKKTHIETLSEDAFQFLAKSENKPWDMILLDPPALIKTKKDEEAGKKAYHFLNRAALRALPNKGILVTSSCSHFLSEEDFIFMLRRAAVQAGVKLHILDSIRQSPDHPDSLTFPEARYLKSFIALVRKPSL
jgi:23S rRNA (cytosine1962-C5)-methyltransferase